MLTLPQKKQVNILFSPSTKDSGNTDVIDCGKEIFFSIFHWRSPVAFHYEEMHLLIAVNILADD